ncbi:MAG: T9SS type A sorting domain-containing protein, partial [Candidatus Marinimicrobia bacterium]|nr:T9SS type A sorting domain-containing protein [Candidatus Neomarinimicrobiota bacterium]
GYPTAKFGFLSDFSNDFKKSFINDLVDEFPNSTIIHKNNAFVVYPANVTEFRDPIKLDSLRQSDSLYTWITQTDSTSADTNYYTHSDMIVEFTAKDPGGLEGKDTVTFFINPINDPPVWAGLRDTVVKENDSLYLDFANYLTDVDDSTLTLSILPLTYDANITVVPSKIFEKKPNGYEYTSTGRNDTVKFKPDALWFKKDAGPWDPTDTTSNQIKFKITAADNDTSAIDTFVVKVQRVPRPEIRMYVVQNNAFTNYYEIFLVDSVGKTKDLTLKVQSKAVTLDTAAAFTYVGHYSFQTKGNYTFEVDATGIVGDTSITENVGLTLAKMYGKWSGNSADGQFQVIGQNGSVDFDQSIMILDSTLFEPYFNDRASYLLGNDAYRFKKSVEISMPGDDEEMAIYRRSTGSGWIELPSITMGNRVNAYTEKMGYFRMGPKTLIVPGQTSLHQNYPNPFNPVTTIEYDLGFVDGPFQRVTVTVYDILGRNVKTLVSEEQSIGRYRVRWNGKDGNGVPVSSGVYFVHLLTDMGRSQTKKIMLMR